MSLNSALLGINPDGIKDPATQVIVIKLLNIIETQHKDIQELKAENQRLRDENNRLNGEQGKPTIRPKKQDASSEKERKALNQKINKQQNKKRKKHRKASRTHKCQINKDTLPADAQFKGYETTVIPELIMTVEYVQYRREKYYSPLKNKTYIAPLPKGYKGQFSPSIRSAVITLKHDLKATESNITTFLNNIGCNISNATISRILTENLEIFHQEKEAIAQAGIVSQAFVQTDDTMARVNGENHHTHIICNPYFTAFYTEAKKDRLTVLDVLRLKRPREYRINQETFWLLEQMNLPTKRLKQLHVYKRAAAYMKDDFEKVLNKLFPDKEKYTTYQQRIKEAAYISGYHQENICIQTLVCDDAKQFKLLTKFLGLCWVHEGRHYKKLQPIIPYHRKQLDDFLKAFWVFYGKLLHFKMHPSKLLAKTLDQKFDELCSSRKVTYNDLMLRLEKTKNNKSQLLTVLLNPDTPLHNNASELGARVKVRDRDIRLHTMSKNGTTANDTFLTIIETAKKLKVNTMDYIYDRVSCAYQMPSLANLIIQQAAY